MHLLQAQLYGARGAEKRFGDRLEIVADCGSWLLGSTFTPYRDDKRAERGVGCTERDVTDARDLLAGKRTSE